MSFPHPNNGQSVVPGQPNSNARATQDQELAERKDKQPKTQFQAMSDLHLENNRSRSDYIFWPTKVWPVRAPYLILAGDISNLHSHHPDFVDFLSRRCGEYSRVFLVAGNNEFKNGLSHAEGLMKARALAANERMRKRLIFLEMDRYNLEDAATGSSICILGCTLWTKIPDHQVRVIHPDPALDLERIAGNNVNTHNHRFDTSLRWLREEVKKVRAEDNGAEKKILIITHHPPFVWGSSRYATDPSMPLTKNWNHYLNDILGGYGFGEGLGAGDMWVFGHTHHTTELVVDNVRVYSNQRGYNSRRQAYKDNFDVERTFLF